ncbi:hypothetical protein BDZ90DRAFT_231121 [Jaminaea rosea]|uniref:GAR domain-containing protein n=1 Tax=Jaminaea rosea TaxID=1569628 RepID=A0A316UYX9_9BASI|nr:hypothetical protein BDZ90DRAFT_231121 [Jaminaea rosea]PWN29123.1 hypothetical protein BDZ90DRAFT_231121 [Jaminaea rosea]
MSLTPSKRLPRSTSAGLSDLSSSSPTSPIAIASSPVASMTPNRASSYFPEGSATADGLPLAASTADLADSIQNLSLTEDTKPGPSRSPRRSPSPLGGTQHGIDLAHEIATATSEITSVRSTLFELEEKRHSSQQPTNDEMQLAVIRIDDQLETISRIVQQLQVAVRADEEATGDTTVISHHDSEGGIGSDSDDDDDFALPGVTLGQRSHKQQYQALARNWDAVQDEVETFKKELRDDKYMSHFNSASTQAEGLMDSLEKAVALAAKFVEDHRSAKGGRDDEESHEIVQRLDAVKKTLKTKRNYYYPAIEQTFAAFERSLKERATSHGMLLRKFAELKTRWSMLRQKSSRMDRELKRIETAMIGRGGADGGLVVSQSSPQLSSPSTPAKSGVSSSAQSRLTPGLPSKSRMRTPALGPNATPPLSPPAPPKPLKSTRRLVSAAAAAGTPPTTGSPMRSGMTSSPSASSLLNLRPAQTPPSRHNRSASASVSPEPRLLRSAERSPGVLRQTAGTTDPSFRSSPLSRNSVLPDSQASPAKRVSHTLTSRPPSSFRFRSKDEGLTPLNSMDSTISAGSSSSTRITPQRGVPPRTLRAGSEPPVAAQEARYTRPASALGASPLAEKRASRVLGGASAGGGSYESNGIGDESMETLSMARSRPGSASGNYTPAHYRPPSSATTHVDPDLKAARRQSRIPTFSFPSSAGGSEVYDRPGSSLSQASSAAGMGTPRRFGGASRSTMQTPEPIMAARVQRLSVYSKPSTGAASTSAAGRRVSAMPAGASSVASRPPTTRSNPRSPASSILSSSTSGSRYSSTSTGTGRTTPLSASALAKIPHARPLSVLGASGDSGATSTRSIYAQSVGGGVSSSVANYRTARTASNRLSGVPRSASGMTPAGSVRDGAATPTFSERSGHSSFSAIAPNAAAYRPNPNDALDVAVSTVTNALGVPLTRLDEHLPRGVKTETGPGKEVRCRYSFGGGPAAMCKLLELHRASTSFGQSGGVQRKVLVKVPGKGFLDLELWLLSAFD